MSLDRRMFGAVGASALLWPATAQTGFPNKPLQFVLPFPPGGASDVLGRILARELEVRLGQPVIVVNKPGAGTIVAAQAAATSPPDGYTLFMSSNSTFTLNPAVHPTLPYDSARDFDAFAIVADIALAIITHSGNPVNDLAGMIAEAKAQPDKISLASFGNATSSHFAGEMFKAARNLRMVHVPYRGSAPMMNDLVGRHIPYAVDTVVASAPQRAAGKIKVLAVTTAKRSQMLPDVPTLAELGFDGFDFSAWIAVVAPKGLNPEPKAVLTKALADILANADVRARLVQNGFEPRWTLLPDWPERIGKEIAAMKAVAQAANIKAD